MDKIIWLVLIVALVAATLLVSGLTAAISMPSNTSFDMFWPRVLEMAKYFGTTSLVLGFAGIWLVKANSGKPAKPEYDPVYLPDGRWRGTENLPDGGYTANIFNSRVHPPDTELASFVALVTVFALVIALLTGLFGLVIAWPQAGNSLMIAGGSFVFFLIWGMTGG